MVLPVTPVTLAITLIVDAKMRKTPDQPFTRVTQTGFKKKSSLIAEQILKLIKMPDGSKSIVIQGKSVFKVDEFLQKEPYFRKCFCRDYG